MNFFIKYAGKGMYSTLVTNKPKAQILVQLLATVQDLTDNRY